MKYFLSILGLCIASANILAETIGVTDKVRNRKIPTEIYYPDNHSTCTLSNKCPVIVLSSGYGVLHTEYDFLVKPLRKLGYMVVAISHEIAGDPPLSISGNLYENRGSVANISSVVANNKAAFDLRS